MSQKYATGTIESRRENSNLVKEQLYEYYRSFWDVEHIADVEENRAELTATTSRSAKQLLECADIDTIVDTFEKQIAVQEKLIYSPTGRCLSIRMENNREGVAPEADRLRKALHDRTVLIPTVIAYGKVVDGEIGWLRLLDAYTFIEAWLEQKLVDTTYTKSNVNNKLFFEPETVVDSGAVIASWGEIDS